MTEPAASPSPDVHRWSLRAIAGSALGLTVAYGSAFLPDGPPAWAPWLFVVATAFMMVATMALGAARRGRIGRLWGPFVLVLLILVGGLAAVLTLPPTDPAAPTLWLGLPPRAAIVVYGLGLLPFLIVPTAYAWTFDEQTLGEGELERVRDEALRAKGESPE